MLRDKTMKTANFEVEFDLDGVNYRVDGVAYYYEQDGRIIDHIFIESCMSYFDHKDIWFTAQLTKDIIDVVMGKVEMLKGGWK